MEEDTSAIASPLRVTAQFVDIQGNTTGPPLSLPINVSPEQLDGLLRELLENQRTSESRKDNESDSATYSFFIHEMELTYSIEDLIKRLSKSNEHVISMETQLQIVYTPQALFKVRPVSRCSSTLSGHAEAIIVLAFSPDGSRLVSGSGDSNVRFWDLNTETPMVTPSQSHTSWILCLSWSPDGRYVASGSMDNKIQLWHGDSGQPFGSPLTGHSKWIHCLSWQPLHLAEVERGYCLLASGSKDTSIRVWDPIRHVCLYSLSGHTNAVTSLRWAGDGILYSSSRDRTIRAWNTLCNGKYLHSLTGHAHWINTLSLSTDAVLRMGAFDPYNSLKEAEGSSSFVSLVNRAQDNYKKALALHPSGRERLVSGSDDHTLFLWHDPSNSSSSNIRLTGHQAPVNHVVFSPDGRWIASASFDKSVKLWHGESGKFVANFRGHLGSVYQISWSADSRLFVSASKDSTLKCWDIQTKKLRLNLPGHLDEVYAVDWSPDGTRVASGSKDKTLKLWKY